MTWIKVIAPAEANARLERAYKGGMDPVLGRPANVVACHSLRPSILDAHMALYRRVVKSSEALPQSEREAVATAVSAKNDCRYCSVHHRVALVQALEREGSGLEGRALGNLMIERGRRGTTLGESVPARLVAMVEYAMHLTGAPGDMREEQLGPVRAAGLDDGEVLELVQVVAYFNYVNRIVMGLGVELEPEYEEWADIPWDV